MPHFPINLLLFLAFTVSSSNPLHFFRNADLSIEIGLQKTLVSSGHVAFINLIFPQIDKKLNSFSHEWLNRASLQSFADAIHHHPVTPHPCATIVGFIDGKVSPLMSSSEGLSEAFTQLNQELTMS